MTRAMLVAMFDAAVTAAMPRPFSARALAAHGEQLIRHERLWIVALGKAAHAMAAGAVDAFAAIGRAPTGGIVVAQMEAPPAHAALEALVGDHPVPGRRSAEAAERLGALTQRVQPGDGVACLISGGTTSLVGAPIHGVSAAELAQLGDLLLASGLDIVHMNAIRKRVMRWGAGRLAAALAPAMLYPVVVSDVIGNDLATIASGPLEPDPLRAVEVVAMLREARLWTRTPPAVRHVLEGTERGAVVETPKPGDAVFGPRVPTALLDNGVSLAAAAECARRLGVRDVVLASEPLRGEARSAGAAIASAMLARDGAERRDGTSCVLWGGETTVTLGDGPRGAGGRCQELALAAAEVLAGGGVGAGDVTLLAAGTDGRDGVSGAAGAIVDRHTWQRARAAGRDPRWDLDNHDAAAALGAGDALLVTGDTGTNVMDVVFALRAPYAGSPGGASLRA